ncbi:MAG: hypothetical protein O3B73_04155 [bacterium]|jgi:hypothetical protein|nr:hypothetical protein [bacterium]
MESESLWKKVKQGLRDGAATAAEKAEHYGKLSRARLDMARTRHAIQDALGELGGQVFHLLEHDAEARVDENAEVKDKIQAIKDLEAQLKAQDVEFSALQGSSTSESTEGVA